MPVLPGVEAVHARLQLLVHGLGDEAVGRGLLAGRPAVCSSGVWAMANPMSCQSGPEGLLMGGDGTYQIPPTYPVAAPAAKLPREDEDEDEDEGE